MNEKSKVILVTGGAGFVGTTLCARLKGEGHRVISLDNYFTGLKENHVEGVEYREGSTKDVEKLVPEAPDLVFHLGEYSRTEESFNDIPLVWEYNMIGTHAVLEYCRKRSAKIVYAGSSTKYADNGAGRDQSPYAWTKATNTDLVKNYGAWFGLPYAITYFYNVYGPRELSGKYGTVTAIFERLRREGKPLTVREPGTQRRHFTHVDDIVDGLLLVGERGQGDEYGLGSEESFTILEVAQMFGGPIEMIPNRKGNRLDTKVDYSKAQREFGWKAYRRLKDYIAALQ
ncbi:MAG TPA: NAD-dependent epimerase/dehydratase family protein [Candidatus Paceibacterota bacterium]|nr:NAD-dependent epimerase/dehydratase family protein [Candidatus Paceibacterota bacterium]